MNHDANHSHSPIVQLDPQQGVYHRGLGGKEMEAGVFSVCKRPGKPLAGEPALESLVHSSAPQSCQTSQLGCSCV